MLLSVFLLHVGEKLCVIIQSVLVFSEDSEVDSVGSITFYTGDDSRSTGTLVG